METIHFVIEVDKPGHTVSVDVNEYGALVDEPDVAFDETLEIALSIAFRRLEPDQARAIAAALTRAADWVARARS